MRRVQQLAQWLAGEGVFTEPAERLHWINTFSEVALSQSLLVLPFACAFKFPEAGRARAWKGRGGAGF